MCAKSEVIRDGLDSSTTSEAVKELKKLVSLVLKRHFGGVRTRHQYLVVEAYPMVKRISQRWYKTFMQRMIAKCAVKHLWKVIQEVVSRTGYGVNDQRTGKHHVMAFTNGTRVRRLFCEITGNDMQAETFLKKKASGDRKVEVIINEEKQFGICYKYDWSLL